MKIPTRRVCYQSDTATETAGAKLEENNTASQLFLTLPDSYESLVTALNDISENNLTLETEKQRLLLAEEPARGLIG